MKRIVRLRPAFDKRHPDPKQNYGIHGVDMLFVLVGEKGATQFLIFTNWLLPHVTEEMIAKSTGGASAIELECRFLPMAADLGYHSRTETGGVHSEMCDVLGGECWYDGSGLAAERVFDRLLHEGDAAIWDELEQYYISRFGALDTAEEGRDD